MHLLSELYHACYNLTFINAVVVLNGLAIQKKRRKFPAPIDILAYWYDVIGFVSVVFATIAGLIHHISLLGPH